MSFDKKEFEDISRLKASYEDLITVSLQGYNQVIGLDDNGKIVHIEDVEDLALIEDISSLSIIVLSPGLLGSYTDSDQDTEEIYNKAMKLLKSPKYRQIDVSFPNGVGVRHGEYSFELLPRRFTVSLVENFLSDYYKIEDSIRDKSIKEGKMTTIKIKKGFRIPGTNIMVESGDTLNIKN